VLKNKFFCYFLFLFIIISLAFVRTLFHSGVLLSWFWPRLLVSSYL
jgi:hypothetical protein